MPASLTRLAKRAIPGDAKQLTTSAIRSWGQLTSPLRPLPDFLIVGTKRGGTTSLWNYLLQHPGVLPMYPSALNIKSPHYFYWHYDRGPHWYRSHFATVATRTLAGRGRPAPALSGEASPNYLYDQRVPARVRDLMPAARVIMLLRDPVERAYSHYKERVRAGVEPLPFEAALAAEPERLAGELERMQTDPFYYSVPYDHHAYRDRGVYLPQVRRWLEVFPNAMVLRSEDFYDDPAGVYEQVTDYLGLERVALRDAKRFNYKPAAEMLAQTRAELADFYAPHNQELEDFLARDFGWKP